MFGRGLNRQSKSFGLTSSADGLPMRSIIGRFPPRFFLSPLPAIKFVRVLVVPPLQRIDACWRLAEDHALARTIKQYAFHDLI